MISGFGVEHIGKAAKPAPPSSDRHTKEEVAVGAGAAVAANEARAIYQNKNTGAKGRKASSVAHRGGFRNIRGVSDAVAGTHFNQSTHPEGVYNVSTASLGRARQKPAARRGQDQLRDSIRTKGFDRPVHMKVWEDGKARIWDGHHRTTRAAELGLHKIPVSVTHVAGKKPKPKSVTEAVVEAKHHLYRRGLLDASRVAKRGTDMNNISAFGVEHGEIAKAGGFGELLSTAAGKAKNALPNLPGQIGHLTSQVHAVNGQLQPLKTAVGSTVDTIRGMRGTKKVTEGAQTLGSKIKSNKGLVAGSAGAGLLGGSMLGGKKN